MSDPPALPPLPPHPDRSVVKHRIVVGMLFNHDAPPFIATNAPSGTASDSGDRLSLGALSDGRRTALSLAKGHWSPVFKSPVP